MKGPLKVPHGGRLFICGGLYGCPELLIRSLDTLMFDERLDLVVAGGNLVNYGKDSEGAIQMLREPWFHTVAGDMEQLVLRSLHNDFGAMARLRTTPQSQWVSRLDEHDQTLLRDILEGLPTSLEVFIDGQSVLFGTEAWPGELPISISLYCTQSAEFRIPADGVRVLGLARSGQEGRQLILAEACQGMVMLCGHRTLQFERAGLLGREPQIRRAA